MTVYAHFAVSFPSAYEAERNPFGWSNEFNGDWDRLGQHIRTVCGKLGLKSILLRGYDGCRLPRWRVGAKPDGAEITSGVLTTSDMPREILEARRPVIRELLDDGFEIVVHTGPAVTRWEAIRSAAELWRDGITKAAIDSSGRNMAGETALHLEALEALRVRAYTEPTGLEYPYPALANVRFVEEKIDKGRDVSHDIAWLNDPTEDQRQDPAKALAACVKAGTSTAIPWKLIAKMQGVAV